MSGLGLQMAEAEFKHGLRLRYTQSTQGTGTQVLFRNSCNIITLVLQE